MALIETANIGATREELPVEVAGRDCVLLSVRDTGTGMSPEVLERAFEPFFTTKEIGKGTGLGLSMVFGVVRQSGGTVRICSRLREGTIVQIYLPRAHEAAASTVDRVRLVGTARGAHILVVDDDSDVRWIIAQDLQAMGCIVTEAESGRAALAILEQNPPCDLMVTDLVMPGLRRPVALWGQPAQSPSTQEAIQTGNPGRSGSGGTSWVLGQAAQCRSAAAR